ncbi:MAG: nuclear transport factor 2 family protein [Pseudomonadota bacterium]
MAEPDLAAIQRLLSEFAWAADRGLADAMAALFLADGVLTINGQVLAGPASIAADCRKRFEIPERKTRHTWSNLRVDQQDGDTCTSTAVQLTFETTAAGQPAKLRVSDVTDTFRKSPQGHWRFASRTIVRQMAL